MSYSVSYSTEVNNPAHSQKTDDAPLFALGDLQFLPVNGGATLLLDRTTGAQKVVTSDVARALQECLQFDTIAGHVDSIVAAMPAIEGQRAEIAATMNLLASEGLLLSAQQCCDDLNREIVGADRVRSRAFIITSDRPNAVERLLDSLAYTPGLSRHERLFLIDSSRLEANVNANAHLVADFNTRSAQSIQHITPQRQAQICAALKHALPQYDNAITFLLDRMRYPALANYGAARNFCLLLSAGRRVAIFDDDVLAFRLRAPEERAGFRVAGGIASDVRFFPNVQAILSNIEAAEESAVDGILECLGLPLAGVPTALERNEFAPADLRGAPGIITATLDADSPILITQCGTLGDPGTSGLGWLHLLDDPSRASLLQTLEATGGARLERCCWRGTSRTTVAKMASMSQLTGLDNSQLLPPYFPYFRGEDHAFGAAVDYVHPRAAVLEHNWCIAHLPEQQRSPLDLESDAVGSAGSIGLVTRIVSEAADPRSLATPAARLDSLAALLESAVSRSDHDLAMDYRAAKIQASIDQLEMVTAQLQKLSDGTEGPWKRFLERSVTEINQALLRPWRPGDLLSAPDSDGDARALSALRDMTGNYASGLRAWEAIRERGEEALASAEG